MRRKAIETRWTFEVNGRKVTGERNEYDGMTLYAVADAVNGRSLMFRETDLEPLRHFLAAMDTSPGTKMTRCQHCDEYLMQGATGWVEFDGNANCEESSQHDPRPDEYDDED